MEIKTLVYKTSLDREPFSDWRKELEVTTQAIISSRLTRVRSGNLGACKPIKGYHGLYEIVIDYGPGYRIYYYMENLTVFIILFGGEKKSQKRDIEKAYSYLMDHTGEKS
ncbi:type II toxin-antitoxin system RelE/ParE family toxin [soil metagenome]